MITTLHRLLVIALAGAAIPAGTTLRANNIQVTNATLTGNEGVEGFCQVQFDLTWQNSWRGGNWFGGLSQMRVSNRSFAVTYYTSRSSFSGGSRPPARAFAGRALDLTGKSVVHLT